MCRRSIQYYLGWNYLVITLGSIRATAELKGEKYETI